MAKRVLALAVVAVIALAACGRGSGNDRAGGGGEPEQSPCPPAPAALATLPELPEKFPVPPGLTFTSEEEAGPSTIIEGYWDSDLDEVYREYKEAFPPAGYDVTFSEQEENDAEVNFAGGDTTGQVKLDRECEGRTHVKITIRPAA
jgi:hypothetical protein